MIVTPRDFQLALYTIRGLARTVESSAQLRALIYCNGLAPEQVSRIADRIRRLDRVSFKDNSAVIRSIRDTIRIGDWYVTDTGHREFREGNYEQCGEIWSRELVRLDTDLVAIIDADFEIFEDEFVHHMIRVFADEPQVAFFSTGHSLKRKIFESYAQTEAVIAERWDSPARTT